MKSCLKNLIKILVAILILVIIFVVAVFVTNILKTPSLDRDWAEDSKILPSISISENIIEIKNIRDWRYEEKKIISKDYYDETFDLDKIEKTYLLFNPFGKWEGIGHFFFVFEFEDGQTVSVSIEARRENDEGYNSIKGVFNKYELWYAYGSSADFITRRAVFYEDQEVYMYPLKISEKYTRALFLDLAQTTESLETEAEFYNTVTSNCTNLLAKSANRVKKGIIPFHYSRLFTGFTDDQLYDLGLIRDDKSFDEVYKESRIDLEVKKVNGELRKYSNSEFWKNFIINQDKITDEEIVNNDGLDGNNEVNLNDNQIKKEEVESNNKIEIEESSNKSIKNNEVLKTLSVNFDDCVANGNKIIKISPRRCINEQGEEFYDYSFEGGYTPPDVNINTADIQKNMFPQGKDFSKFTNFDRSYVIFYQGYFNIIVNAYKAYELNGTYEDICYAQPEFIIQQYESSKKTIESEDPNDGGGLVIDFDKLVKSFDCFGSKEDYEIYFSLLQESGDYKEYTVSSKGPIFEIWD